MKATPLFSIIIPVYNIEKYIEECVGSILKQEYKNFEIILVDDGSPDSCPQICDKLKAQNDCITVIHKENGGVSAARRDAAVIARGDYILCVDGDDWLSFDCLLKIAQAIKDTNADVICHGMYCCDSKGKTSELTFLHKPGYYTKENMIRDIYPSLIQGSDAKYFIPSLCGKAIRRELFNENLLSDRRAVIGEDGACVIPCIFHAHSIFIMTECLYYYRYNVESATKSRKVFSWDWIQIVNNHIMERIDLDSGDFRKQIDRKITHDVFTVAVTQFYKKDTYRSIVKQINEQLMLDQFNEAITRSDFKKSLMGRLMKFALKNRWLFLVYIYSKLK